MQYSKPPLTYEQQAEQLIRRGLLAEKEELVGRLQSVNYYRLSGYLFPFKKTDEAYKENTSLDMVWANYCFDRQLRLLLMDAIERFEIAIKTDLTYNLSHKYGPFCYLDPKIFPKLKSDEHGKLLSSIDLETHRSKEIFVAHFFKKYGDVHKYLPLWMATEVMSFGTVHSMYKNIPAEIKQNIAKKYGVTDVVLVSWIGTLHVIRNICAHHGQMYNRILGVKPVIPNKDLMWHTPCTIDNSRIFSILSILNYLLRIIAPRSGWKRRVLDLLSKYEKVPRSVMGFYDGWADHDLWKDV